VNVEPTPSRLFTQIRPPCSSTNFRHKVSPSVLAEGDPIATELVAKYKNIARPNLRLDHAELTDVLLYLEKWGRAPPAAR